MPSVRLTTFVHPSYAYRLQYADEWECLQQDDARSCGFGPRDRDDVGLWISILPLRIDTTGIDADLPGLFAQAMAGEGVNPRRAAALRHRALEADVAKPGEAGHFWMIAGGDLILFASSQTPADERNVWNPQFERVMASLEILRGPDLLLRRTADEVCRRLRARLPDQDYQPHDDDIRGRHHRVSLASLYAQVVTSPERRGEFVDRFVEGLAFVADHPPGEEQLDTVRDSILPMLKPTAYFQEGTPTERLVRTAWVGTVTIGYAISRERAARLITDWDLGRWGVDQESLHDLAIDNLRRLPWPERLAGAREADGRVILVASNDGFDASRLLHPDLHGILSGPLGSPFYAGVPTSTTLVAFSAGNDALFEHVLRQIRCDYDQSAAAITPVPFLVTAGGVRLAQM